MDDKEKNSIPLADKCGQCKYWQLMAEKDENGVPDLNSGNCRRYPPTPFTFNSPKGPVCRAMFPPIHRDGFCGEFQRKPSLIN